MGRAIFEEIFDGPDSIFGRVFGPSREKLAEDAVQRKPRRVRVSLTPEQLVRLTASDTLTFQLPDMTIEVRHV